MKRYTVEWALAPKQVRITRATRPKPFPGKYPTRIAWKGTLLDGKPSSYIGKPTRKALAKFYELLRGYQFKEVCIVEFDRTGVIARDKATNVLQRTCDVSQIRAKYHPFPENSRMFPVAGQWRKLLYGVTPRPTVIFWPDNVPVRSENVPPGYGWLPQPVEQEVPTAPTPIPEVPMPPVDPFDIHTLYDEVRQARQRTQPMPPAEGRTIRFNTYLNVTNPFWGDGGTNNGQ